MTNVVIVSAARTAVGSFNGAFANTPAHDLGAAVMRAVVEPAPASTRPRCRETILGQVLTAGQGQNPARQAHINAGLPKESAAWGINQVCGSGLRAVALGAQHIQLGDAAIVVAGGQESMSLSPHVAHLRAGQKMGDLKFIDSMIKDGLWDAFNGYHMGTTAENVANQWQISREHAGRLRRGQPEQGRGGAEGRQVRRRDRRPSPSRPARATSSSIRTNTSATARRSTRCKSCAPPSPRTARSPPATPRASTTARRRCC